jgi:hypothetical protein
VIKAVAKSTAPRTTVAPAPAVSYLPPSSAGPTDVPPSAVGADSTAAIIKWAAIGLGLVVTTAGIYYVIKRRRTPAMAGLGSDWKPYTHNEATKMASNRWGHLWSVEEVDTKPGTVMRRTEGPLAKHHGEPIAQQFKVRLHSNTGPLHWIAIREDGTPMFDGGGRGLRGSGERYKTFVRSGKSFESFSRARKHTVDTGLTYDEAQRTARRFNAERTSRQISAGTKMEFIREG